MPQAANAAAPSVQVIRDLIVRFTDAAIDFVPRERAQATMRKWLDPVGVAIRSDDAVVAKAADALLLSADLVLSHPSASGTTAFDRLARSHSNPTAAEAAALAALRAARFRLLTVEKAGIARDAFSGEALRLVGDNLPALPAGTALFGRLAMLGGNLCCFACPVVTPLDAAAFAVAHRHPAAGRPGAFAQARWAEAVYLHIVRYGTLNVPGLNRPAKDAEDVEIFVEGGELFGLAKEWRALAGAEPGADLLRRTRDLAGLPLMLDALVAAVLSRDSGKDDVAAALERLLLVQMETTLRRERIGSGTLTLEAIGRAVDEGVAAGREPPAIKPLFAALRQRLGGTRRAEDPALERLVQRIQGLRAKTVAQGCTEQEALAAAEKVAELLDRYGLSLDELDFRAQPCEGIGVQTGRRRAGPIDGCVVAIAAFFDCRVWMEQPKGGELRYVFFGLRGDVTAAHYLYDLVERAFETETAAFKAGPLYAGLGSDRRTGTTSFQTGLARGIAAKLQTMRAARNAGNAGSGRDLVPVKAAMVDEEMAKLGLDLRSRTAGQRRSVLSDAFHAGRVAGERFEPTPGITRAA